MRFLLAFLTLFAGPAYAQTVVDPTQIALVCAYNSVVPAPTSGQYAFVQCDSTGKLITAGAGGTPGGTSGQVQYNNAGAFGGANIWIGTNIFDLYNSTTAQTWRVYNTRTDASNYERGIFDWAFAANVLTIGTDKLGTGVSRNLQFIIGGANKLDYGVTTANVWTANAGFVVNGNLLGGPGGGNSFGITNAFALAMWNGGQIGFSSSGGISGATTNDVYFTRTAAGIMKLNGATYGVLGMTSTVVGSLPAAATAGTGARAFVTDATACTFATTIVGGGSTACPVYSDGTNWKGG